MKRILLRTVLTGMVVMLGGVIAAFAADAGIATGKVRDSGGGIPADGDFDFSYYITARPGEVKTRADVEGIPQTAYDAGTGDYFAQLSLFSTNWSVGETIHLDFTDNGGPTGVETGSDEGIITGTNTNLGQTTLPVELSVFEARAGDTMVLIIWETESETDNLGFYLYRAQKKDGEYTRITKELIKGAGTSSSANEYKYLDQGLDNGTEYYYKLEDVNVNGERAMHGPISAMPNFGLSIEETPIPETYGLSQNYPNPFNPTTEIRFQLPEKASVQLTIYNLLGQKVRTLVDEEMEAGYKSISWNGIDDFGNVAAAGVYIYEIHAGSFAATKKMVMLK